MQFSKLIRKHLYLHFMLRRTEHTLKYPWPLFLCNSQKHTLKYPWTLFLCPSQNVVPTGKSVEGFSTTLSYILWNKKQQISNASSHFLESSISWAENISLTYCSQCVKSNGRHWWLRKACATCHQPKCKETLPCGGGGCQSGSAAWLRSGGHCFLVPGTCTEKSHMEPIESQVQIQLIWSLPLERWSRYAFPDPPTKHS